MVRRGRKSAGGVRTFGEVAVGDRLRLCLKPSWVQRMQPKSTGSDKIEVVGSFRWGRWRRKEVAKAPRGTVAADDADGLSRQRGERE